MIAGDCMGENEPHIKSMEEGRKKNSVLGRQLSRLWILEMSECYDTEFKIRLAYFRVNLV